MQIWAYTAFNYTYTVCKEKYVAFVALEYIIECEVKRMFVDSYKLREQRPDYLVNLERKAQRAIDRVENLEANIENVDWHEFEAFEDMLEKARIESIEAQRAYNFAFLKWSHSHIK